MNAIYIALPFAQGVLSLFLASVTVLSEPRNRLNIIFAGFLVALAAWGILIFGMRDAFPDRVLAYSWEKAALAVIPFSGVLFYHFVHGLTGARRPPIILAGWYALAIAAAAASIAGQSATGMVERFYGFAPELGWAFPLVLLAAYPPVLLAIWDLNRALPETTDPQKKAQLKTLRLGIFISVLGGTTDFFPSLGLDIYPMGVVGNIGFALITTWAVTRHRLMNLRLLLRRGLAYTLVSSLILALYGVPLGVAWFTARGLSATAWVLAAVGAVLLASVVVQPLVGRIQTLVDRLFFRERYDHLVALATLSEKARDISDLRSLADDVIHIVRRATQSDWAAIALPDESAARLAVTADTRGPPPQISLSRTGALASWFLHRRQPLRQSDLGVDPYLIAMSDRERTAVETLDAELIVPMFAEDALTGVLILGPRLIGSGYPPEVLSFLATAADRTAVSVENARLYAEAQREARERTVIAEIGRAVSSSLDIDEVFRRFGDQVRRLIQFDRIVIVTLDAERGIISPAYVEGTPVPGWRRGSTHALHGSGIERVVEEQESLLLTRGATLSFPRYAVQEGDGVPPLRSAIAVPLVADDRVIAVLEVARSEPDGYSARDRALLQRVSAQIAGAFANARLHEQTIRLARERELRQRLDQEKRELERVNEEKSKFLSTVSHELKTPLASILALAEVLMKNRQGNLQDRQVEHIQVIHRSGRRLGVLINDLVDMSRIDSGQLTLDVAPFDTLLLFDELIPAFMPILATRHQTFKLALPLDPLWIEADRDRVEQVVTNIISNASKYSPDAAVIELGAAAVDGRLEVTVRDHGIGISEEDQRQLFTAFFRAGNKETRNVPGTGLGLVIAKSLVEMHDGEIRLESERGRGTTVTFSLPNVLPGRPETDEEADHPLWSRRVYREQDFAAD